MPAGKESISDTDGTGLDDLMFADGNPNTGPSSLAAQVKNVMLSGGLQASSQLLQQMCLAPAETCGEH